MQICIPHSLQIYFYLFLYLAHFTRVFVSKFVFAVAVLYCTLSASCLDLSLPPSIQCPMSIDILEILKSQKLFLALFNAPAPIFFIFFFYLFLFNAPAPNAHLTKVRNQTTWKWRCTKLFVSFQTNPRLLWETHFAFLKLAKDGKSPKCLKILGKWCLPLPPKLKRFLF